MALNLPQVIAKINDVPMLPSMMMKIINTLNKPDCDTERITSMISKDQALTVHIIKTSNSAFYARPHAVASIKEAILALGIQQVKNIVLTKALFAATSQFSFSEGVTANSFWKHAKSCGILSGLIGDSLGLNRGDCFTAGLIHDVGILLLGHYYKEDHSKALSLAISQNIPIHSAEKQVMGITHTDIAAHILKKWLFPDTLILPAALHHSYTKILKTPLIVKIVTLADLVCKKKGWNPIATGKELYVNPIADIAKDLESRASHINSFRLEMIDELTAETEALLASEE